VVNQSFFDQTVNDFVKEITEQIKALQYGDPKKLALSKLAQDLTSKWMQPLRYEKELISPTKLTVKIPKEMSLSINLSSYVSKIPQPSFQSKRAPSTQALMSQSRCHVRQNSLQTKKRYIQPGTGGNAFSRRPRVKSTYTTTPPQQRPVQYYQKSAIQQFKNFASNSLNWIR